MKSINLKIEEQLKLESQKTCKNLGISLSSAIKLFLINMNKNKALPFAIEAVQEDPFYSKKNQEAIEKSFKQIENGEIVFKNFEDL